LEVLKHQPHGCMGWGAIIETLRLTFTKAVWCCLLVIFSNFLK
jgi:hypothetical protein